ncbi:MAG: M20/M25/M40 family metallo-hydrolase [Pyrinomonadaceae bacterium]
MLRRKLVCALVIHAVLFPAALFGQTQQIYEVPKDVFDKIKDEGTKNSQVMKTLSYMTDVIGPRLTGSPGMKRANDWTRDTLGAWGLQNAHLESWGPFGRGWTLKKFHVMVDGPTMFPLISYPKAWSPGTETLIAAPVVDPKAKKGKAAAPAAPQSTAFTGEVVRFTATKPEELEQYKGKLKGKIVLIGPIRDVQAWMTAPGERYSDKQLLDMADSPNPFPPRPPQAGGPPAGFPPNFLQAQQFNAQRMRFLSEEGAAILIDSARGDGGTIFVQGAQVVPPATPPAQGQPPINVRTKGANVPIQISAGVEHFNRVARMIDAGEKVTMTIDLAVQYQDDDLNAYNTIAEIPGSDKADEIVMLGGHLDSWHGGTGATDNGAGCAVMMEAVRIIHTLGLKPRRTIRIALWSGEEQGLLGSRAYVRQHFGYRGDGTANPFGGGGGGQGQAALPLTKLADYEKFSAYYNIDNGTGKIRGVYMQGNEGVRPIFRQWLSAVRDPKWWKADFDATKDTSFAANTLTLQNTGGTDHLAFDAIGLPGFQFIQDEIEYDTRTHHSNMDVFDRIQADDMKQMSIILAVFVYQTAMMDEKIPRKPIR